MDIRPLEKSEISEAARAVYEELERRSGRVPNLFRMLGDKPEVLRTYEAFLRAVWAPGALSPKWKQLVFLRASLQNGCVY